jgi:FAD-linked sulfhydryl oxidase
MVLGGADGKPCKVCTAFRNWNPSSQIREGGQKSTEATTTGAATHRPLHCPLDVEQLGRATWSFLHTTAAYYPEHPTASQRTNMLALINSLPTLYPCTHCASHLGRNMKEHPPDVSGGVALSRWFCERHNDVNERLGKALFDCTKTIERWKDGPSDGTCE